MSYSQDPNSRYGQSGSPGDVGPPSPYGQQFYPTQQMITAGQSGPPARPGQGPAQTEMGGFVPFANYLYATQYGNQGGVADQQKSATDTSLMQTTGATSKAPRGASNPSGKGKFSGYLYGDDPTQPQQEP